MIGATQITNTEILVLTKSRNQLKRFKIIYNDLKRPTMI